MRREPAESSSTAIATTAGSGSVPDTRTTSVATSGRRRGGGHGGTRLGRRPRRVDAALLEHAQQARLVEGVGVGLLRVHDLLLHEVGEALVHQAHAVLLPR